MPWYVIGFLATLMIGFTTLQRMIEGYLIRTADVTIINSLTITHRQEIFGLFSVPVVNPDFFTVGFPALIKWDYAFFGGNATMISYLFSAITAAVAFGLFLTIIGMTSQYFSRR